MTREDTIVISFTSWVKRIQYCIDIFKCFLNQTLIPDKIVLNLSTDEFTNKEKDLPRELLNFVNCNSNICEIHWVKENTLVWKKFMPTLDRYPDAVIIPVDDDIIYCEDYVEKMYTCFLKWGRQCPITCYHSCWQWKPEIYFHSGAFSLVKREFFGDYLTDIYNNVVIPSGLRWLDDPVYSYASLLNGKRYKLCTDIDSVTILNTSERNKIDPYSKYEDAEHISRYYKCLNLLNEYLISKYNKSIKDNSLLKAPIIVNVTTWTKRDRIMPKMVEYLTKQTVHPDKVILWLSEAEYDKGNLPQHITDCVDKGFITEIRFVSGHNTYAHKKWETFKYNNDCYNIMCDDDLYYPADHIEKLLECAYKNAGSVPCYYSQTTMYDKNLRLREIKYPGYIEKTLHNDAYSGLSCYPPYVFPIESYKYSELRDKYVTRCDDSWVQSWLIHENINPICMNPWNGAVLNEIQSTEDVSTWTMHTSKTVNGTMQKVINMATALSIVDYDAGHKTWPTFDIRGNSLYYKDNPDAVSVTSPLYNARPIVTPVNYTTNYDYTLVAIMKDENRYVREWLDYYKELGITHVIIIDNNFIDGESFYDVIPDYISSGFVEIVDRQQDRNAQVAHLITQKKEYFDAYNKYKDACKWFFFYDGDEFLYLDGMDIPTFFSQPKFNKVTRVLINWKNYDDNGLVEYDDRPVQERFTHPAKDIRWLRSNSQCKSAVRGGHSLYFSGPSMVNTHKMHLQNDVVANADGTLLSPMDANIGCDLGNPSKHIYIKHYVTKTISEYLARYRGRINGIKSSKAGNAYWKESDVINNFFKINERTPEKIALIEKIKTAENNNSNIDIIATTPKIVLPKDHKNDTAIIVMSYSAECPIPIEKVDGADSILLTTGKSTDGRPIPYDFTIHTTIDEHTIFSRVEDLIDLSGYSMVILIKSFACSKVTSKANILIRDAKAAGFTSYSDKGSTIKVINTKGTIRRQAYVYIDKLKKKGIIG